MGPANDCAFSRGIPLKKEGNFLPENATGLGRKNCSFCFFNFKNCSSCFVKIGNLKIDINLNNIK